MLTNDHCWDSSGSLFEWTLPTPKARPTGLGISYPSAGAHAFISPSIPMPSRSGTASMTLKVFKSDRSWIGQRAQEEEEKEIEYEERNRSGFDTADLDRFKSRPSKSGPSSLELPDSQSFRGSWVMPRSIVDLLRGNAHLHSICDFQGPIGVGNGASGLSSSHPDFDRVLFTKLGRGRMSFVEEVGGLRQRSRSATLLGYRTHCRGCGVEVLGATIGEAMNGIDDRGYRGNFDGG
ncbi:hypothetical protein RJ639_007127 [Escallonia herrerae]|uniref:Uncharacterized protein n=1 Tax=Escallonia herrerae TaxID=1293975 RepID=A0AA88VZN7_9ASTE|nr:hypothetical protein RJ639_007127 [Escallonia herrerae]